jgi:hypothetical protein
MMLILRYFLIEKSSFKWYNKNWSKASSYQEKEPKMIISESREKVKKVVKNFTIKFKGLLSLPQGKFVMEMVMGMLITGSTNLTQIAKSLKEKTKTKHTLKRLLRMSDQEELLKLANKRSLEEAVSKITDRTVLALDGGDIVHQYGEKFEKSSFVKDGSSGEIRSGYPLNQVSGYNDRTRETFPILLDMYSTVEKWFKSANCKTIEMVNRLVERIGVKGLWVIDRGYDSGIILKHFLSSCLRFIVRMKSNRDIIINGERINIKRAAKKINRRIKYGKNSRFGGEKVILKLDKQEYKVTLISYKDRRNKEIMIFLTSGWIKSSIELKRRIRGYFKRWGVEESYRFEKQGFGIEKSTVRKYSRIRTLLGISLMSWLVLIKINEDMRLKEVVLKEARMEKEKLKDRPKFIYYRLLIGIKEMFSGIRELFSIRLKIKKRKRLLEKGCVRYFV